MGNRIDERILSTQREFSFGNYDYRTPIRVERPRGQFTTFLYHIGPTSKAQFRKFYGLVVDDAMNKDEVNQILKSYMEFNIDKLKPLFKELAADGDEAAAKKVEQIIKQATSNLEVILEREGNTMKREEPATINNTTEEATPMRNTKKAETKKSQKKQTKKTDQVDMNPVKTTEGVRDTRQKVTDFVIAKLEEGTVPWRKPWSAVAMNMVTKKPYSLLNQILLGDAGYYMSFTQVKQKGGKIKKGAKAKFVTFYKQVPIKVDGENGEEVTKSIPYLRYYNVFHQDMIEGIEFPKKNPNTNKKFPAAKTVANRYLKREGIKLYDQSTAAYYAHNADSIHVPNIRDFESSEEYYAALFHEMVHSTMKETRLNRERGKNFGDDPYAKEELIAEIGAAILCNYVGIDPTKFMDNSAAYIAGWSKRFAQDKNLIVSAAGKAEKAVDFILNGKAEAEEKTA